MSDHRLGAIHLEAPIASGATAALWRGRHEPTGARVAVKVIRHDRARDAAVRRLFEAEVRAVAGLDHPAVIRVHDYGRVPEGLDVDPSIHPGDPYLVMQLADGELPAIERTWPEIRDLLLQLLGALGHAHARGVVHRDVKPANILVVDGRIVLADFGLASLGDGRRVSSGGSPLYMAPEQFAPDRGPIGPWTDLYALGGLGWWLATGRAPFAGQISVVDAQLHAEPPPLRPRVAVPDGYEAWLRGLLAKDPAARPQWAADAAAALEALDGPTHRAFPSPPEAAPPSVRGGAGTVWLTRPPLVGRHSEQAALWAELAAVAETGSTRLVVLRGPEGVGKSALAAWLAESAHERGAAWPLIARHSRYSADRGGPRGMLEDLLGAAGLDVAGTIRAAERLLARTGGPDRELAREVASVVRREPVEADGRVTDVATSGERLAVAARLLKRISARRPVLLWLEDAHYGLESVQLAARLVERPVGPVLVVLAARDHVAERTITTERIAALPASATIDVAPLAGSASAELVRTVLGHEGPESEALERWAGGVPLLAVQVAGAWVSRGALVWTPDGRRLVGEPALPADLDALWADRLDAAVGDLDANDREGLDVAALLGADVDVAEWTAACRLAGVAPALDTVDRLLRAGLARDDRPGRLVFVHPTLADAIARRVEASGRAPALHEACAQMLAERTDIDGLTRRARHRARGPDIVRAIESVDAATHLLLNIADHEGAESMVAQVARLLASSDLPPDHVLRARHLFTKARVFAVNGRFDDARATLSTRSEEARRHGWVSQTSAALQLSAYIHGRLGRFREAAAEALEAIERAHAAGDVHRVAAMRELRARYSITVGDLAEAERQLDLAIAFYAGQDDAQSRQNVLICRESLSYVAWERGDFDRVEATVRAALAEGERTGNREVVAWQHHELGELAWHRGDLDTAEELLRHARDWLVENGSIESSIARMSVARIALERDHPGAWEEAVELYGLPRADVRHRVGLGLAMACHAARRHDWPWVVQALAAARADLEASGYVSNHLVLMCERLRAAIIAAEGPPELADTVVAFGLRYRCVTA